MLSHLIYEPKFYFCINIFACFYYFTVTLLVVFLSILDLIISTALHLCKSFVHFVETL